MFPDLTPLDPAQREMLQKGLTSLRPEQLVWLSGYLSGRASSFLPANEQGVLPTGAPSAEALATGEPFLQNLSNGAPASMQAPASATIAPLELLVLYGTESGNSEALADRLFKTTKKAGYKPTLKNMSEISPAELKKHENIFTLVSTWGDGEPPETAETFFKAFMSEDIDLKGKNFSVIALGDSSYEQFCQTGKDFDTRFEALGATRVVDREDCDVDFEDNYDSWSQSVLSKLEELKPEPATQTAPQAGATGFSAPTKSNAGFAYGVAPQTTAVAFDKSNPFPAETLTNINLNGTGSAKETIHLELSLEGSGLQYEVGDALAVIPKNADDVVEDFLAVSKLSGEDEVEVKKLGKVSLKDALKNHLDITALSRKVVKGYQEITKSSSLADLLSEERKAEFKSFLWGREIRDLFSIEPFTGTAQDLVNILRKLPPRLYSIASSMKAHPDEVHLTVAAVRYDSFGKERKGVASTFLADDAKVGENVSVFVQKNKNFRLPEDPNKPIIMVGPGTGIAPFRAFIEERAETNAPGESWLFFGDQRYSYDFLYQLELQDHIKNGDLTKLDVAFSRDQPKKVYVQHKMLEKAEELWDWLDNKGANFYICGDANRMAVDVHKALIEIIKKQGGKSQDGAEQYLDTLKREKRYQRDVY